jgi:hypothetical protein
LVRHHLASRRKPIVEIQVAPISSGVVAGLVAIVAFILAFALFFAWITWGAVRMALTVDGGAVHLRLPLYGRSIPLSSIDLDAAAVVDLTDHPQLAPRTRTNGIGMPGMGVGWFRLRDGSSALMAVTDRRSVLHLPTREGFVVLVSVPNAERALEGLRSHSVR